MNSTKLVWFITIVFSELLLLKTHCAEFLLVFPSQFRSHYYTLLPLITALADKGHRITIYSAISFGPHPNITEIIFEHKLDETTQDKDFSSMGTQINMLLDIEDMGYKSALNFFKTLEFHELMSSNNRYDAIITVSMTIQEYLAVLQHKFNNSLSIEVLPHPNAPMAAIFSGIPFNPSYYVDSKLPYSDTMNFWERLHNTYNCIVTLFIIYFINIRNMQSIADQYMRYPGWEDRPSIGQLMFNKSLILVNGHHSLNYPYPLPPNVIDIAGINIRPNQPLPETTEHFINSWPNGVIVLSWGSIVAGSKVDNEQVDKSILSTFATLKQGVIWKTNKIKFCMPLPPNVITMKWLPQQDVLAHKNIKVFMTHGGMNSMVEAVYYGVPVVVTPFFYDQGKNARKLVKTGMGVQILPDNITRESLSWAVNEIINNERYKEAAMRTSARFRDRPMTPIQEAIHWIEYVIRHGDILRPVSTNMPFYKLFLIDVITFIISIIVIIYYIIKIIMSYSYEKVLKWRKYYNKKIL